MNTGVVITLNEHEEFGDQLYASSAISLRKDPYGTELTRDGPRRIVDVGAERNSPTAARPEVGASSS